MRRSLRNLILALLLVVVGLTLGRFYSHHSTPTSLPTTSTSTTSLAPTTSVPTSSVPTTTAPTTSTTRVSSLTTCRGSQFTGVNVGSQGAAGTAYDVMTLTKVAGSPCTVDGYPLLTLLDDKGVVTGVAVSASTEFSTAPANAVPVAHTIVTGQKVDIQLRYFDVASGSQACANVSRVSVQFVAGDTPVVVPFAFPIAPCQGAVGVSGFYPA